jgi:hypothetical protein
MTDRPPVPAARDVPVTGAPAFIRGVHGTGSSAVPKVGSNELPQLRRHDRRQHRGRDDDREQDQLDTGERLL